MAGSGVSIALQWAACLAILAWAVWFVVTRLKGEFAPPAKGGGCHHCAHCHTPARQPQTVDACCDDAEATPAAKLKSG